MYVTVRLTVLNSTLLKKQKLIPSKRMTLNLCLMPYSICLHGYNQTACEMRRDEHNPDLSRPKMHLSTELHRTAGWPRAKCFLKGDMETNPMRMTAPSPQISICQYIHSSLLLL